MNMKKKTIRIGFQGIKGSRSVSCSEQYRRQQKQPYGIPYVQEAVKTLHSQAETEYPNDKFRDCSREKQITTFKTIKRFVFTHSFVGYWKYYSIAGADEDLSQAHQLPRLVELIEDHGKYVMSIYTPSKGKSVIWSSSAFPKRSSTVSRSAPS